MPFTVKRAWRNLLCWVGLHQWTSLNEPTETLPGDMSPDRVTQIRCDWCGEPHPVRWHLTESDGPASYTFPRAVSEAAALRYLAAHYSNATVDYIDREWHCIFYRIAKKKVS